MNIDAINELVTRWAEPGGIPFKGKLISDDGCMCAQGQALHYIGGWDADALRNVTQEQADADTAALLGISRTHAVLLRQVNDNLPGAPSVVLTDPASVIGDQAEAVLAFWHHLDTRTVGDWVNVAAARAAARDAARAAAGDAAWAAAGAAAGDAAVSAAGDAARATAEIQGASVMRAKGQPFFFLPLFGFATPEDVIKEATDAE